MSAPDYSMITAKEQQRRYEEDRERMQAARARQADRDLALARNTDVETSHAAARHAPELKDTQRREILELHARTPSGLSDDEVCTMLGGTLWRRCSDLRTLGLIEWRMERYEADGVARPVTRTARSGRQGRVSVITLRGRAALDA